MDKAHTESCSAPLCSCNTEPGWKRFVIWYPGEEICTKGKGKFKINQRKINKLVFKGQFKYLDRYFTADDLSHLQRITGALKGRNSNKTQNKAIESPYFTPNSIGRV